MTRVASQLTFCSPQQILRHTVVEQDDTKVLISLFGLESQQVESAHTLFYDGIISMPVVSLKQHISSITVAGLVANYQYFDLTTTPLLGLITPSNKPLVLDFGTTDRTDFNRLLQLSYPLLRAFSIFEIIAACVYYPALLMGLHCSMEEGVSTELILWQGVDLVNKKLTQTTAILEI